MVIDANTGKVLYEQFADAKRHPASLTKIMTLFLVFGEIEQGRLSSLDSDHASAKAAAVAPSKLDLDAGEEIERHRCHQGSRHQICQRHGRCLAEHIGGTEAGFVRMMNERARQIGMRSTTFNNASGLPDNRQITTARDMVTLALRLQDDFPQSLPALRDEIVRLPRQDLPHAQHAAARLPGHGRHQDRLHEGLRLQPRLVGARTGSISSPSCSAA